jgi:hypothetical protein
MTHPEVGRFHWRKSSRSSAQSQCVEVAGNLAQVVGIRDSKNPDGPAHVVSRDAWGAFVRAVASERI